jgi:Tellurite resistance protein TerB
MFDQLSRPQRLQLMKFVCSFAWADLEIRPEERDFVARMMERLELDPEERRRVRRWLDRPPAPDSVDPASIPDSHRKLFLEAIEGVIAADGVIAPEESESLAILRDLLG